MSNDFSSFVERVESKGNPKSVTHITSKGKFEEEDLILVRILKASTKFDQEISQLRVVDAHPRVKNAPALKVCIVGGFPHREIPFHEGEIIALGNGCVFQNEKGKFELGFTRPQKNTIIRKDFEENNEEEILLDFVELPEEYTWTSKDDKETLKSIKKWLISGLITGVPKDLTINQASSINVCRFNLACKVQEVTILSPHLGVITVADGTICRQPIFTVNENSRAAFKRMSQSNRGADIIISIKTENLEKRIKEGSYIQLNDIQVKKFSFEHSKIKECIIFKVDGRNISYDTLKGSAKERVERLVSSSECDNSNQFQTDINSSKLLCQRKTHNHSQNIYESSNMNSRKHLFSLKRKRITSNPQEDCIQPVASPNVSISSQRNLNETSNTNHTLIRKIFKSWIEDTPGQNNAQDIALSSSPEDFIEDETIVNEKRTNLRTLKYLPRSYNVNVWIKDVSPSLLGSQLDLVKVRCSECKTEQRYSIHKNQQKPAELETCPSCSRRGVVKLMHIEFNFTLRLWDTWDREISVCVTGENAEKFLKCTAYRYISDKKTREQVWITLCKLKDRGCSPCFRCARDMIQVDVGVTVEKGTKKYILLGGVLNNHVC